MTLYTIGFTKKSARDFFDMLETVGVRRLIDVRLHNVSQLAGFAKKYDLAFFLERLAGITYEHRLELAPTEDLLAAYRARRIKWSDYERQFRDLITSRRIEDVLDPATLDKAALLCSEHAPDRCHRRLVAEHFRAQWPDLTIEHLV